MRPLLIGLSGLMLAACGSADDAEQTYGPKPGHETPSTPGGGNQIGPPQNAGEPATGVSTAPDPSGGGAPAGAGPSQNQSRPMQAS